MSSVIVFGNSDSILSRQSFAADSIDNNMYMKGKARITSAIKLNLAMNVTCYVDILRYINITI